MYLTDQDLAGFRNDATRALVAELYYNPYMDDAFWDLLKEYRSEGLEGTELENAMASSLQDAVRSAFDSQYEDAGILRSFFIDPDNIDYDYRAAVRKYLDEEDWESMNVKPRTSPRKVPARIEDRIADDFLRDIDRYDRLYGIRESIVGSTDKREILREEIAEIVSDALETEYDDLVPSNSNDSGYLVYSFVAYPRTSDYDPGIVADRLIDVLSGKPPLKPYSRKAPSKTNRTVKKQPSGKAVYEVRTDGRIEGKFSSKAKAESLKKSLGASGKKARVSAVRIQKKTNGGLNTKSRSTKSSNAKSRNARASPNKKPSQTRRR